MVLAVRRLDVAERELAARFQALAESILDVTDSEQRHVLAARLDCLREAHDGVAFERGRDGWLRAAANYRPSVNPIAAFTDYELATPRRVAEGAR